MPINHQIKSKKVRLIDENGKPIGIVDIDKALDIANQASLDLVEIASNSNPVVCKILNSCWTNLFPLRWEGDQVN